MYVSLGEAIEGDKPQWSVRVYYKPFVSWLWYGAILMALGGLLAVSDRNSWFRFAPPVRALAQAPITVLAQVAGTSTDEVKGKLTAAGLTVANEQQSVADLVGPDLRQQIGALTRVLPGVSSR